MKKGEDNQGEGTDAIDGVGGDEVIDDQVTTQKGGEVWRKTGGR